MVPRLASPASSVSHLLSRLSGNVIISISIMIIIIVVVVVVVLVLVIVIVIIMESLLFFAKGKYIRGTPTK